MKIFKKIDSWLSYIWNESNFVVLFIFNFLLISIAQTLAWYWAWRSLGAHEHIFDKLSISDTVILISIVPAFMSLMFTPLMLMKRMHFKMTKIIKTFELQATESKDMGVLLGLQNEIAEFRKKEVWKLQCYHYGDLSKIDTIIISKLQLLIY